LLRALRRKRVRAHRIAKEYDDADGSHNRHGAEHHPNIPCIIAGSHGRAAAVARMGVAASLAGGRDQRRSKDFFIDGS
jgi:hypothetical protein